MKTIREREEETLKNQFNLAVRDLIKSMNSESNLNITIVEEETSNTTFEFLLEYPPYEDSRQQFQRRVSNIDSIEFINNVFDNIEDLMGYKYRRDRNFVKATTSDSRSLRSFLDNQYAQSFHISTHKQIRIRIQFVEEKN